MQDKSLSTQCIQAANHCFDLYRSLTEGPIGSRPGETYQQAFACLLEEFLVADRHHEMLLNNFIAELT